MGRRRVEPCSCIYNGTDLIKARSQAGAWEASLLPMALLLLPNITMVDSPNFCLLTCINSIQVFHHPGWAVTGPAVLSLVLQRVLQRHRSCTGAEGRAQSCGFTAQCAAVSEITELGTCLPAQPLRRLTHGLHSCIKGE